MTRRVMVTRSLARLHKATVASRKIRKEDKVAAVKEEKKKSIKKDVKSNSSAGEKLLELGLLCDCTGSMATWIDRAKKTLKDIIENTVKSCDGKLKVRVCFVGYRDLKDNERFAILGFDQNLDKVKKFISTVEADGGGDEPEDVVGGLHRMINQKWTKGSERMVFHICDAPCHGN